jgi:branched-chain amino acid transport system ATP-binding protein
MSLRSCGGAGKTTLVNLTTGALRPTGGRVRFDGCDVTGQQPHQAARRGIARTFQIVQPFPEMTVIANVAAAAFFAGKAPSIAAAKEQARAQLAFGINSRSR